MIKYVEMDFTFYFMKTHHIKHYWVIKREIERQRGAKGRGGGVPSAIVIFLSSNKILKQKYLETIRSHVIGLRTV